MATPAELYPFSTQDGKAIGLDVIKPLGVIYYLLSATFTAVVLPAKYNLSAVYSSVDAYIDLTNTASGSPVSGADNVRWVFIPAATVVILELPTATVRIRGVTGAGNMYITALQKYAALGLPRQFDTKTS